MDLTYGDLKEDHAKYPLSVFPKKQGDSSEDHIVLIETFSPIYAEAYDFLIGIAEPDTRPNHIHEYIIKEDSLRVGITLGYSTVDIQRSLEKFSKYRRLPSSLLALLHRLSENQSMVSLGIYDEEFFIIRIPISLTLPEDLKALLQDCPSGEIDAAYDQLLQMKTGRGSGTNRSHGFLERGGSIKTVIRLERYLLRIEHLTFVRNYLKRELHINTVEEYILECSQTYADNKEVQEMRRLIAKPGDSKVCAALKQKLREAFRRQAPPINAQLKPTTDLRDYQALATKKVISDLGNGLKRCSSGLVVLPCGAGKSLLGISCACALGRSCIVVTNGNLSSKQWKYQFLLFSDISEDRIFVFSAERDDQREFIPGFHIVFISTYQMLTVSLSENQSAYGRRTLAALHSVMWGIVLFDEVHQVFAETYSTLFRTDREKAGTKCFLRSYCKIGLTATPLREDDRMKDLFLLGNKLYESNWSDLANRGFIATLQCAEVHCPMHRVFYEAWYSYEEGAPTIQSTDRGRNNYLRSCLEILNPYKVITAWYLKEFHTRRGDQVLMFCDTLYAAEEYARQFHVPFITGRCKEDERECIVSAFTKRNINCLMLSKVGDTSLDLPDANVIIELDWQSGSRRQETQRVGRISRPKSGDQNAYFYILVSEGTRQQETAENRREYLCDNQGYPYSTIACKDVWKACLQMEAFAGDKCPFFRTLAATRDFLKDVERGAVVYERQDDR